jgi:DNA-directed RNA polymerase specialized sigma24 family protein
MKTAKRHDKPSPVPLHTLTDSQLNDELDALMVRCASQGDAHAIGAIALAFGKDLLKEARAVMGDFAQDAEDVLQDFLVSLLEGRSRFTPEHGRALLWMRGVVLAMARKHCADREREWETGGGA